MSKDNRSYKDRAEYLKKAVSEKRRQTKLKAIEYKGGKCQICGYVKYTGSLVFHHIDDKSKDFGISAKGYARSWQKVKDELDKCVLVCANCHHEIHAGIVQLSAETQE